MPEYDAPDGSMVNSGGGLSLRPRKVTVWNSLLRKRTESPWWMRRVDGKKRLSSVPLGVPAGALPGEPAQADTVRAMAPPGTARTRRAAAAMPAAEIRFDTLQLLGVRREPRGRARLSTRLWCEP